MKIAIISDTHGNVPAFKACVKKMIEIEVSSCYHVGDLVGYIPSLSILNELELLPFEFHLTKGNHEERIVKKQFHHEKDNIYNHKHLAKKLSQEQEEFLKNLPDFIELELNCGKVHLSHGGPQNPINGYIYQNDAPTYPTSKYDFIFCGNTHRSYIYKQLDTSIINVGSCGFPRDKGKIGTFAVLDTENGEVEIKKVRIPNISHFLDSEELHMTHESIINNYYR